MNENDFIRDLWDVIQGNIQYITQEQFIKKYRKLFDEYYLDDNTITLSDKHNEWRLTLQKVWSDGE